MTFRLDPHLGIKLRVESDGTPGGCRIVDSTSGAELWGVESVIIQMRRGEPPTAIIRVANVQMDVAATVEVAQEGTRDYSHD